MAMVQQMLYDSVRVQKLSYKFTEKPAKKPRLTKVQKCRLFLWMKKNKNVSDLKHMVLLSYFHIVDFTEHCEQN